MARDLFPLRTIKFLGRDVSVLGQNEFGRGDGVANVSSARRRHLLAEKLRVENELLRIKIRAREMEIEASEGTRTGGRR